MTSFLAYSFRLEQLHSGHLKFCKSVSLSTVTLPLHKHRSAVSVWVSVCRGQREKERGKGCEK